MNVICPVCKGIGKVDKSFGLGQYQPVKDDFWHSLCPGCDGKGIQSTNVKIEFNDDGSPALNYDEGVPE